MTETAQTQTTNPPAGTQEPKKPAPLPNDFAKATVKFLKDIAGQYMPLYEKVKAATENRDKLVQEIRDTSEDPQLVKFRQQLDELDNAREKLISAANERAKSLMGTKEDMSPEQVEAAKTAAKDLRAQFVAAHKLVAASIPGVNLEEYVPMLPTLRGSSGNTGAAEGTRKLRVDEVQVNGKRVEHPVTNPKTGEKSTKSGFSDAARVLKGILSRDVTTQELIDAYFQTASVDTGRKVTELADAPAKVDFRVGDNTVTVIRGDK